MVFTVRQVAIYVINRNQPYYSNDLLQCIPRLLDREFGVTGGDTQRRMLELDDLRIQKTEELAQLMKLHNWKEDRDEHKKLMDTINSVCGGLIMIEYREMARQVKFLFNVAAAIGHW